MGWSEMDWHDIEPVIAAFYDETETYTDDVNLIQRLISKNLDLEKFQDNARYIIKKYPHVLLEMELMIGFPTETEEEA